MFRRFWVASSDKCRQAGCRPGLGGCHDRPIAATAAISDDRRSIDRSLGSVRFPVLGELREWEADMLNRDEEDRIMLAAAAIAQISAAMPLDLAISSLMVVVTELIRGSEDPATLWAALEWGVQTHRRLQHRIVAGSDRLQ